MVFFQSYSQKYLSEGKLINVDKQKNGLMGFEPPSRTIHSITRQHQCDHDHCAPAFSQVNLLPTYSSDEVKCELVNIADDLISQLQI
jgi:hypothetical protein